MDLSLIDILYKTAQEYIVSLDWSYILTLMVLVEVTIYYFPTDHRFNVFNKFSFRFKASYRVMVTGLVLALMYYWFNGGDTREHIKIMFQSMIAAIAFHAWLLKPLLKKFNVRKYVADK